MVFRVLADIINASFWHWLSCVIEPVRPSILGHVILPRFMPVKAKHQRWAFSFASFILCFYRAKEPVTGLSFLKELTRKLKDWKNCINLWINSYSNKIIAL